MAIVPNFPLLASDQADVIRIFLELMHEVDRAGRTPEVTSDQPVGPRNDPNDAWFLGKMPDFE